MPELPDPDVRRVLAYQRRLIAVAMEALGRLLLVCALLLLAVGLVSGWRTGSYPLQILTEAFALLVVGVGLAIADDYLPAVPDASQPPTGETAGETAVA
jgi:uncharacterized membrane protein